MRTRVVSRVRRLALASFALCAALLACGGKLPTLPKSSEEHSEKAKKTEKNAAMQLVHAATSYSNVRHEYLLDSGSALQPGRCIERTESGSYRVLPSQCASVRQGESEQAQSEVNVDSHYIGVAIDDQMIDADASLAPWASVGAGAGERTIKLVAMAFVRERDPQFFGPGPELQWQGERCAAGRASHFVGSVKLGAMLSYELRVRHAELRGSALSLLRARIAAGDSRINQRGAGELHIDGLSDAPGDTAQSKPLQFTVKKAVPVAYAVYPLSDVCKFAFPEPELSPMLVDFGDVPSGSSQQRTLRLLNRAKFDVHAQLDDQRVLIPAESSGSLSLQTTPQADHLGCRKQERERLLTVTPAQPGVQVSPRQHTLSVREQLRSGKALFLRNEHVDTGTHTRPDYTTVTRQWQCPQDYELKSCQTEARECGESACNTNGYAINATPEGNGCKFTCNGPKGIIPGFSSYFCRFDAVMECALRCR